MSQVQGKAPSQTQSPAQARKQQELQLQYQTYKNNLQQLASKIGDVEGDAEEHKLVLETLTPLPGDRKCYRLINGVLVERTVQDVVPALQTNAQGLKTVLEELLKQYRSMQTEMEQWKKKENIQLYGARTTAQLAAASDARWMAHMQRFYHGHAMHDMILRPAVENSK